MFRACCVVIILAQTETVVQSPNAFLAVFPRMRGAFSTFYTNTTKLFPQCWRGYTKFSTFFRQRVSTPTVFCAYPAEYDVCRRLRSTLVLHPQQRAFLYNRRIFRRVKFHVFFACEFPSHPTIESNGAGVCVQHAQRDAHDSSRLFVGLKSEHLLRRLPFCPGPFPQDPQMR